MVACVARIKYELDLVIRMVYGFASCIEILLIIIELKLVNVDVQHASKQSIYIFSWENNNKKRKKLLIGGSQNVCEHQSSGKLPRCQDRGRSCWFRMELVN